MSTAVSNSSIDVMIESGYVSDVVNSYASLLASNVNDLDLSSVFLNPDSEEARSLVADLVTLESLAKSGCQVPEWFAGIDPYFDFSILNEMMSDPSSQGTAIKHLQGVVIDVLIMSSSISLTDDEIESFKSSLWTGVPVDDFLMPTDTLDSQPEANPSESLDELSQMSSDEFKTISKDYDAKAEQRRDDLALLKVLTGLDINVNEDPVVMYYEAMANNYSQFATFAEESDTGYLTRDVSYSSSGEIEMPKLYAALHTVLTSTQTFLLHYRSFIQDTSLTPYFSDSYRVDVLQQCNFTVNYLESYYNKLNNSL